MHVTVFGCLVALLLAGAAAGTRAAPEPGPEPAVEGPVSRDGVLVYTVTSPYQKGPNTVEVLLPDGAVPDKRYPALYILPVEPAAGDRYGSGMAEARRTNVHNLHGLVCVAPAFDATPWYADHPTDPAKWQESYLLKAVLPLVESRHPVLREPRGRLLVGFSKSGWGAWSLLLRHPDVFGRAAAWDAPLLEEAPARYGMADVFGTQENFERYRLAALLEQRAGLLRRGPVRLVLTGHGQFGAEAERMHRLLVEQGVPHLYDNQTRRKHHWHSGWFADTVRYLTEAAPR